MQARFSGQTLPTFIARFYWVGVALTGLLITSLCFYPGLVNMDSTFQLVQAQRGAYADWHPPLMSFVWRYLDFVIAGSGGIFLLHGALFWFGISVFAYHAGRRWQIRCGLPLIAGLYLPVLFAFGMVVKDSGMLGALVFSCGMLLDSQERNARLSWVMACFGMFYAIGVRHNAGLAVLPLCLWAGAIAQPGFKQFLKGRVGPKMRSCVAGFGVACFLVGALSGLTRFVIKPELTYSSQSVMLFDLVALSVASGRNLLPEFYARQGPPYTVEELRKLAHPLEASGLIWPGWSGIPGRAPGFVASLEEYRVLQKAWRTALLKQPTSYLRHRWTVFKGVLGFQESGAEPYWMYKEEVEKPLFNRGLKRWLVDLIPVMRPFGFFKAWVYVGMVVFLLIIGGVFGVKHAMAFWSIGASVLLYEWGYFIVAPSAIFRYSWWAMGAIFLLAPLLKFPSTWALTRLRHLGIMLQPQ